MNWISFVVDFRKDMARQVHSDDEDQRKMSDDCLSTTISSSTLEIILDDQFGSNSDNEESNSQDRYRRERWRHRDLHLRLCLARSRWIRAVMTVLYRDEEKHSGLVHARSQGTSEPAMVPLRDSRKIRNPID